MQHEDVHPTLETVLRRWRAKTPQKQDRELLRIELRRVCGKQDPLLLRQYIETVERVGFETVVLPQDAVSRLLTQDVQPDAVGLLALNPAGINQLYFLVGTLGINYQHWMGHRGQRAATLADIRFC